MPYAANKDYGRHDGMPAKKDWSFLFEKRRELILKKDVPSSFFVVKVKILELLEQVTITHSLVFLFLIQASHGSMLVLHSL